MKEVIRVGCKSLTIGFSAEILQKVPIEATGRATNSPEGSRNLTLQQS